VVAAADHELMLSTQFFETPKVPRYHEIVGGPGGPSTNDGFPVFFEPNDRLFLHARYRWASPFAFAENLELHLGQQVINDDRNRGVDEVTNEEEHNRSDLRGFTVKLDSRPGPRTLLVYGIDLYRDEVDSDKSRTDIPTGEISVRDPTFPDGATEDSFGAYANVEWQVTGPWLLETGLRYSRVQTDLPATAASAATDVDNDEVTGHVGSALRVAPNVLWTMNLARGFRAPNIFDLGTLGRRPNTSPQQINVPNPNLDPETIDSIDTGLKWQAGDFVAEASVFYARYHDRSSRASPRVIPSPMDSSAARSPPAASRCAARTSPPRATPGSKQVRAGSASSTWRSTARSTTRGARRRKATRRGQPTACRH
jgi:outer membrane receptor protein involved in Fe transport